MKLEQKIKKLSCHRIRVNAGPTGYGIVSRACMELCWKGFQEQKNNIEAMVKVQSPKDEDLQKMAKCWKG